MYNNSNSQEGNFPQHQDLPDNPSLASAYLSESAAEKRPRIQHPNEMYHNFITAPLVVPAMYNPSNGTYSFISNIPATLPLRNDFADSSEDGSNSETQGRSNYMCRKCNKPKKGHICTMQQQSIIRRAAADPPPPPIPMCVLSSSSSSSQPVAPLNTEYPSSKDAIVQVEIDSNMTVRELGDLSVQGLTSSYESMSAAAIAERRARYEIHEPQPPQQTQQPAQNSFSF